MLQTNNKKYDTKLINALIPITCKNKLESTLISLTPKENKSTRFLIKMELARLKTACVRAIDLRRKTKEACEDYVFADITHYLDQKSVNIFEYLIKQYGGEYTVGVYEAVLAAATDPSSANVLQELEQASQNFERFDVEHLYFGDYRTRNEDRIHFRSEILLAIEEQELTTFTADISTVGIRFLLPEEAKLAKGQEFKIRFAEIAKNYVGEILEKFVNYKVVSVDSNDEKTWIRALRTSSNAKLDEFLTTFIKSQKVFNRVDASDLEPVLLNKGYEKLYMPKSSALPLFFNGQGQLNYILSSERNQEALDYWHNQNKQNILPFALTPKRIKLLLQQNKSGITTALYGFTLVKQNSRLYFVATEQELEQTGLLPAFIALGLKYQSLRVFKLQLAIISSRFDQLGLEADGLAPIAKERLQKLRFCGAITDITHEEMLADYQAKAFSASSKDLQQLRRFMVAGQSGATDIIPVKFISKRKEARYDYKMQLRVIKNDSRYIGYSKNVSVRGLQVELESAITAKSGDLLTIELPGKTPEDGSSRPFAIVAINESKTILHLKSASLEHNIDNQNFFHLLKDYVDQQVDKTPTKNKGLSEGLCRLYTKHGQLNLVFLSKQKSRYQASRLATHRNKSALNQLLSVCSAKSIAKNKAQANKAAEPVKKRTNEALPGQGNTDFNLYPILNSPLNDIMQSTQFKCLSHKHQPLTSRLFIFVDNKNKDEIKIISKFSSELTSPKLREIFLSNARNRGEVYVLQLELLKTPEVDCQFIDDRIAGLKTYSRYRIDGIKDELAKVEGVLNIVDITAETLQRMALKAQPKTAARNPS
ncbi:PilZ domain-containing protein [Thalassomonas actiniarum]|uniref:PilZ domain-containing protein n=1 Tax=Thalassomonas actiniarum TaxID=485447 RepID=A0AAE9YVI5_9GAMM|nr:PilZ domain-containing protein [Thalassomonas actiniarum]WDE01608.1 PilZ domain-containing protein [Thalassomonas actiniarum]